MFPNTMVPVCQAGGNRGTEDDFCFLLPAPSSSVRNKPECKELSSYPDLEALCQFWLDLKHIHDASVSYVLLFPAAIRFETHM